MSDAMKKTKTPVACFVAMCLLSFMCLLLSSTVFAQAIPAAMLAAASGTTAKAPTFEVISVRLSKPDVQGSMTGIRPDGIVAENIKLKVLLGSAYNISQDLISGLPGWADADRFDIVAKVAADDMPALKAMSMEQQMALFVPILAERFKLQSHVEVKQLPVFDLEIAKGGTKLIAKNKPAEPEVDDRPGTGKLGSGSIQVTRTAINGNGVPIRRLVQQLANVVHRTVLDKTSLEGDYDFALTWLPEDGAAVADPDSTGPSIFTALQEQLGLKLQTSKGPVDTLVIDHIELPSEN